MTEHQIPLILSSATSNGAINKSPGGDFFEVILQRPVSIPKQAKTATIELNQSTVWNTVYNISTARTNNQFRITTDGSTFTIVIPDGLYTLGQLEDTIDRELVNQGIGTGALQLIGDEATQKVILSFTKAAQQIDFTVANSCRAILGFDSALYPPAPTAAATNVLAPNLAQFNLIDYYLLRCDIVGNGININGQYKGVIAKMLISSPPGSQSINQPVNPVRVPIYSRIGQEISRIQCRITDQAGDPLQLTDDWSMDTIIRYTL